jgi:hypothetical protein
MSGENVFSVGKFFSGFVNPMNGAKAVVQLFWMLVVALMLFGAVMAGLAIKNKFLKPRMTPPPVSIVAGSGAVHNSADDVKKKFGVINIW